LFIELDATLEYSVNEEMKQLEEKKNYYFEKKSKNFQKRSKNSNEAGHF